MKIRISQLRKLIREAFVVAASKGNSVMDFYEPPKGFYDYEVPRGTDIHSFWYKSPGRPMGQDGDPFRPEDAFEYIGMKTPSGEDSSEGGEGEESSSLDLDTVDIDVNVDEDKPKSSHDIDPKDREQDAVSKISTENKLL
jgi:hypothetical protein